MTCGKTIFVSRREAAVHGDRMRRNHKGHEDLLPYFCKPCGGFHLGHRRWQIDEAERRRRRDIARGGACLR